MRSAEGVGRDPVNFDHVTLSLKRALDINLIREAAMGAIETIRELLAQGANPNFRDERAKGFTALQSALRGQSLTLSKFFWLQRQIFPRENNF